MLRGAARAGLHHVWGPWHMEAVAVAVARGRGRGPRALERFRILWLLPELPEPSGGVGEARAVWRAWPSRLWGQKSRKPQGQVKEGGVWQGHVRKVQRVLLGRGPEPASGGSLTPQLGPQAPCRGSYSSVSRGSRWEQPHADPPALLGQPNSAPSTAESTLGLIPPQCQMQTIPTFLKPGGRPAGQRGRQRASAGLPSTPR